MTSRPSPSEMAKAIMLIALIADRYNATMKKFGVRAVKPIHIVVDLLAAHETCPLNLEGLLYSDNSNFMHDVAGIRENINHTTGELDNLFLPRYALNQGVSNTERESQDEKQ